MFSKTLRMRLRKRQSCCTDTKIPLLHIGHTSRGKQRICFRLIQKIEIYHLQEEQIYNLGFSPLGLLSLRFFPNTFRISFEILKSNTRRKFISHSQESILQEGESITPFLTYFPYFVKVKVAYEVNMLSVYNPLLPCECPNQLYETWHVYHGT
jgi:hypothetical protein